MIAQQATICYNTNRTSKDEGVREGVVGDMTAEITDLQKKRAGNLIWNAAADYGFIPDFRFYTPEGEADVYWNSILGLARKHYAYDRLKEVFRALETEEEGEIYQGLLWLGLENALVAKEEKDRPVLRRLQREYARRYLDAFGGSGARDDRFYEFLAEAHYRRILGLPQRLSVYDVSLLDELEFPPEIDTDELVSRMRALLLKWFAIRAEERRQERKPFRLPGLRRQERQRRTKEKLRRFGPGLAERLFSADGGSELPEAFLDRRSSLTEKELRTFMTGKYGRSIFREDQILELEKKLCEGNHRSCHLHLTRGAPAPAIIQNAFEALQKEKEAAQIARNRAAFYEHEAENRIAISRLTEKIQNSVLLYLQPWNVRTDAGELEGGRVWRAVKLNDGDVFVRKDNANAGDISVDILLDASTSQKGRLESISGQAFCIAEALTRCRIPCRVSSFCSMSGYTILRIFRDYTETGKNEKIFDFVANGCNRDGLAIRVLHRMISESACEHRLLIILSDVKPQDIVRIYLPEDDSFIPYEAENAVRDTAREVRLARADGISVICVFTGEDQALPAAKAIYGRDFARIRSVDLLADTVGRLIQNQIKNI